LLGVLAAVVLGFLIFRGGVKINLSKFFRVTGVVLVLVGAGLLAFAVHTAHEAGWWNIMLGRAVDLRWLIDPGSVQSALITGMFGIQPEPTWGELLAFATYAIPMTIYVCRPQRPKAAVPARPTAVTPTVEAV
jgi:high-affinity iron transporter